VACHEAGHAIQHAQGFAFMHVRTALVPATSISSWLSYPLFFLGMLMNFPGLLWAGIVLFSASVVFAIVTLPVEWDASARAKKLMVEADIVPPMEARDAGAVLDAAFLTYVAAAVSALLTLLYYLMRAGLLGGRRD
jgi:Zn-dependent membrane protease YugP